MGKKKLSNRTNPVLVFLSLRGFQVFENFLLKHRSVLESDWPTAGITNTRKCNLPLTTSPPGPQFCCNKSVIRRKGRRQERDREKEKAQITES